MSTEATKLAERRSAYRDYPEELKASVITAIEANGGNVLATAKLFNLPQDTVYYWWKNSDRFREIQKTSAKNLADKLEDLAHSTTNSLAEHDLGLVTFADKARSLGVIIDKMQLLRGQPTAITATYERVDLTVALADSLADVIDVAGENPSPSSSDQSG